MSYLLAAEVVAELRKGNDAHANVRAWAAAVPPASLFLSAMTLLKLQHAVILKERAGDPAAAVLSEWIETRVLPAFEGRFLPVDAAVALEAVRLRLAPPASDVDALLAATARIHRLALVTANPSPFRHTGVHLVNPWDPFDGKTAQAPAAPSGAAEVATSPRK